MSKTLILALSLLRTGFAVASPDVQEAADDVCECMAKPNQLAEQVMKQAMQAQASGDTSAIMARQGELMNVMSAAVECFEKLPKKYPQIDQDEQLKKEVMAIADRQCPSPASRMMPRR